MGERTLGTFRTGAGSALQRLQSTSEKLLGRRDRRVPYADSHHIDPASWRCRQEDLFEFDTAYQEFVAVVNDALQYGPVAKLEADYQRLRVSLQSGYTKIRRYVVAFLRYCPEDAQVGVTLWGHSADAFEALVAPQTLEELLRLDDGSMVSRILRTKEALELYGEHLGRLAAQS